MITYTLTAVEGTVLDIRGQMITYTLTAVEGTVLEYQRANDYLYTYCSRRNCPGVSEGK